MCRLTLHGNRTFMPHGKCAPMLHAKCTLMSHDNCAPMLHAKCTLMPHGKCAPMLQDNYIFSTPGYPRADCSTQLQFHQLTEKSKIMKYKWHNTHKEGINNTNFSWPQEFNNCF